MSETRRLEKSLVESCGASPLSTDRTTSATTDHTVWSCVGSRTAVRSIRTRLREFLTRARISPQVIDDAELAVSELATNALLHSRSGQLGGVMTLFLRVDATCVHAAIADQGSRLEEDREEGCGLRDDEEEYGRGKLIVDSCTDRNGEYWTDASHVTWFEMDLS